MAGEAIAHVMTPRTVNAIPMANTKLAGFGAMYPSWLQYLVVPVLVLVPRANGGRCVSYFTLRCNARNGPSAPAPQRGGRGFAPDPVGKTNEKPAAISVADFDLIISLSVGANVGRDVKSRSYINA